MIATPARKRGSDLLAPALSVLQREGPEALTMRRVAEEAGVTATALYRHYADKDSLLKALVKHVYVVFLESLTAEPPQGNPEAWLRIAFDRFTRFGLDNPNYYRLLFIEPHGIGIDRYPEDFRSGKSAGFRRLRDIVAECMRAGVLAGLPSRDAPEVALTIYAHMHGLMTLYLGGRFSNRATFERFAAQSMDRLLGGLR
jgi:AcrR family transcriptional regulator